MVELYVVMVVLLLTTALVIEEKNMNIYKPMMEMINASLLWLGEHSLLGQIVMKGIVVRKKEIEDADLESYKKGIESFMKTHGVECQVFGGDYAWSPVTVYIKADLLHRTRRMLRQYFGSWNDEIVPGSCEEDWSTKKHLLSVTYVPKEDMARATRISTKYDLEDLPKGLLKEGCEVVKESKVTVTCSVRCAA